MIMELKTPITIVEESDGMSFCIKDADGNVIADDGSAYGEYSQKMTLDTASRIVACVNACAGFSSDELAGANLHKDSIEAQNEIDELRADLATAEQDSRQKQARIDRLESERDELLAALEDAEAGLVFIGAESLVEVGGFVPTALLALRRVKRAIASVKGGAA